MRRKILSFLLAFCMVLTLVPAALAAESGETGTEGDEAKYNNYTLAEWIRDMQAAITGLQITEGSTELTLTDANRSHFLNVYANLDVFEAVKAEGITATEEQTNTVNGFKQSLEAIKKVNASGLSNDKKLVGFGTLVPYTKLEELNFSTNQVGDNGVLEASEIQVWGETLKVLNLSKTNVTNIDALVKAETTNGTTTWSEVFTALTTLDISETTVPNLNSLAYCSALTTLTAKNVMPEGGLDITGLLRLVDGEDFSTTDLSVDFTGTTVKDNLTEAQKAKINELIDGKNITGLDKYAVSGGDDPTPPTTEVTVTIGKLETFPSESWWSSIGKDTLVAEDLAFDTDNETKTVTVTGALKYATWEAFNASNENQQKGHYLPLNIEVTDAGENLGKVTIQGKTMKEVQLTAEDKTVQLAMYLDDLTNSQFTVKYGDDLTYTVDVSKVVLLPEVAENVKPTVIPPAEGSTESAPAVKYENESASASVTIPLGVTEGMTIDVKSVETLTELDGVTIPDAIKNATSKTLIEVTVKNAKGEEQLTSKDAAELTITIGGLTSGNTYYVFCITSNAITSYGSIKATGTSIDIKTSHLCTIAAVEVAAEDAATFEAAVSEIDADEGGYVVGGSDAPENPEEPETTLEYTANSNILGGYVTVKDSRITSGTTYVVKMTRGSGSSKVNVLITVAASEAGTLRFPVQGDAKISVYALASESDILTATMSNMGTMICNDKTMTTATATPAE